MFRKYQISSGQKNSLDEYRNIDIMDSISNYNSNESTFHTGCITVSNISITFRFILQIQYIFL